jgi:hypothetical protein
VVREGVGAGGEMTQALYAHMNNKIKEKEKKRRLLNTLERACILESNKSVSEY